MASGGAINRVDTLNAFRDTGSTEYSEGKLDSTSLAQIIKLEWMLYGKQMVS